MKKYSIFFLMLIAVGIISCKQQKKVELQGYTKTSMGKVYYATEGEGSQTIVFVHGLGCDLDSWKEQRGVIYGAKEVFLDLPGFGKSDKPEAEYTLEAFAEAVISVMNDTKTDKAILVGHSLGTAVCREVALLHPDRVKALVDVDGVYCLYPKDTTSAEYQEYVSAVNGFAGSFDTPDVSGIFSDFVGSLAGPNTPKAITDYAMSTMPKTKNYVAASTMRNLIKKKYWTGAQITCPALIICTKNSGLMPDNRKQMQALYPRMTYHELDSCGHFIMMEEAEWFNKELNDFIK